MVLRNLESTAPTSAETTIAEAKAIAVIPRTAPDDASAPASRDG